MTCSERCIWEGYTIAVCDGLSDDVGGDEEDRELKANFKHSKKKGVEFMAVVDDLGLESTTTEEDTTLNIGITEEYKNIQNV